MGVGMVMEQGPSNVAQPDNPDDPLRPPPAAVLTTCWKAGKANDENAQLLLTADDSTKLI